MRSSQRSDFVKSQGFQEFSNIIARNAAGNEMLVPTATSAFLKMHEHLLI